MYELLLETSLTSSSGIEEEPSIRQMSRSEFKTVSGETKRRAYLELKKATTMPMLFKHAIDQRLSSIQFTILNIHDKDSNRPKESNVLLQTTDYYPNNGLTNGFNEIDTMMTTLEINLSEYSKDTTNNIKVISGRSKTPSAVNLDAWISEVRWVDGNGNEDDENDDENDDESDDESDDENDNENEEENEL
ncbi:uncharacterized protein BX664DRAFT_318675 [Halteromyces radiatus]|uniref:uncharacterized protein n=1 Tax=Halteromyces radiatus TaxID=101107 RepID=UPI00221E8CFF|nr:uncharacterized protein BX664DRAFT_318675 [Halteromyces radiatus]KAI8076347.1 hypothetical protein BX664DRAFT_318675 [Halteromyces radiatus]